MAVVIREEIEDGILYRITEDDETGLYIKEALGEPLPPEPDRLETLEEEIAGTQIRVDQLKVADLDNKEAIATLYEMMILGV